MNLKKQIRRLLLVSAISSFQLAGASWVALLAARGFSMVEIGLAEACFHAASIAFEIPSGAIADVFGRRKSIQISLLMYALSALCMAFSNNLAQARAALMLDAWGYNFASGAREALAYDSLKLGGRQDQYLRYSARERAVSRFGDAAAILCAGLALYWGYRIAYLLDASLALIGFALACGLKEAPSTAEPPTDGLRSQILRAFRESFSFLRSNPPTLGLMAGNALVGAVCILTGFFLQARLPNAGLPNALLGPALFALAMGGTLGALLAPMLKRLRYGLLAAICAAGALLGAICAMQRNPAWMLAGGFIANMSDDLLQLRTDAKLNDRFPSDRRATLLSVDSLIFSLVMILLSPLAGVLFA